MRAIYNCYPDFAKYGGAELITISLTKQFKERLIHSEILLLTQSKRVNDNYNLEGVEIQYLTLKKVLSLTKEDLIISHHRKCTTLLFLLKILLLKKYKLVHVAHNEFFSLKYFSYFPTLIVAVSNRVKENLVNYFKVNPSRISVIYNGLEDVTYDTNKYKSEKINILYPARITDVKQQIKIVNELRDKILPHVTVFFAGLGEKSDESELNLVIGNHPQFKYIGHINIHQNICNFDYVLLFSKLEGLPTVLIEACMYCKPIICNDVGGNLEILEDKKNGFFANSFSDLVDVINALPNSSTSTYLQLSHYARKTYESKFTINIMMENYLKLIDNV
jgi:glycosyltransferase involved in cell wall biosynthesis